MKRFVLLAITLALVLPGTALAKKKNNDGRYINLKKGTMQLGGSATLNVESYDGDANWSLEINPQAGYFVKKGFEIFGGVGLNYVKLKDIDAITGYSINGGARYFIDMNPMWAYLGGQGAFYPETDLMEASAFGLDALGGVLLPLSKNVALDCTGPA